MGEESYSGSSHSQLHDRFVGFSHYVFEFALLSPPPLEQPENIRNDDFLDWNDGKAIGALVDNVAPGLCPDWNSWNPEDALQNATEAMGLADDWLGVRQLITPDEMVNPNIDEQSMMTYLSQYPSAKLKQGAPIRPRTDAKK